MGAKNPDRLLFISALYVFEQSLIGIKVGALCGTRDALVQISEFLQRTIVVNLQKNRIRNNVRFWIYAFNFQIT